jgi:mannose-6-phosphate isomerase-like protein (cupin superfamily)
MEEAGAVRTPIVVPPEQGRGCAMGRMRAIFKADCDESAGRYSVSEWGLEARTRGPEGHAHPEDQVFKVIAGTFNDDRTHVTKRTYVNIPGGTPYTFENRGSSALCQWTKSLPR